jgi:hypothetical protein
MTEGESREKLDCEVVYSPWRSSRHIPRHRRPGPRDAGLIISRRGDSYEFTLIGGIFADVSLQTALRIKESDLYSWAQDIRSTWTKHVVDFAVPVPDVFHGGWKYSRVFQNGVDQSAMKKEEFQAIGAELAIAGRHLFRLMFLNNPNDEKRTWIGERLWEASRTKELTIRVESKDFLVPWPMIYTHFGGEGDLALDGSNFNPQGFWGYRHVIEQEIDYSPIDVAVDPDRQNKVPISINIDSRINDLSVGDHYEFFEKHGGLACTRRDTFVELGKALQSASFADEIVYFLCHGKGAGEFEAPNLGSAEVVLSDGVPVRAIDLDKWLSGRNLPTEPVVFINACQGGQLATLFYDSLAMKFLEKRAKALIGSQVDIPAVFAGQYAKRFFEKFLDRQKGDQARIGIIVRDLTREFFDQHQNPLGLVYSLYRGIDCFVDWPALALDSATVGGGR